MGMNYVIDYKTLEGQRIGDLDQRVREQIAEGYQPYGNPYTFEINFYQAMIKTSDRDVSGVRRGF
jgi:Domain of unknown function (DUF1737).